jgi:hypothetical protein
MFEQKSAKVAKERDAGDTPASERDLPPMERIGATMGRL